MVESNLGKGLKKFLQKSIVKKELTDELAVSDAKLGNLIKSKLDIPCVSNSGTMELARGIRQQLESLLTSVSPADLKAMQVTSHPSALGRAGGAARCACVVRVARTRGVPPLCVRVPPNRIGTERVGSASERWGLPVR